LNDVGCQITSLFFVQTDRGSGLHMTLNYKIGLFRIWLVLSLLWAVVALLTELPWFAVFGVPIVCGVLWWFCLVVWAIRRVAAKEATREQALRDLRQNLAATQTENKEVWKTEVEPLWNRLQETYRNDDFPISEIETLQQLVRSKLADIEKRRQELIDQKGPKGKAIEIQRCGKG
jgi:hypothetical protein